MWIMVFLFSSVVTAVTITVAVAAPVIAGLGFFTLLSFLISLRFKIEWRVKGDFLYENVKQYITDSIADFLTSIFTDSISGA